MAAESVVERIERLIEGLGPFTIVLEDPRGNSDILHADVRRRSLTREEAAELRMSEAVIDVRDLVPDGPGGP